MADQFDRFAHIVRRAYEFTAEPPKEDQNAHPFELSGIHDCFPKKVRRLFDDGHFADATFNAFKYVEKEVTRIGKVRNSGHALMMEAFSESKPRIALNKLASMSEKDEQLGYRFMFAGGISGIRNPRGHGTDVEDDQEACLRYLQFATMLLVKIQSAGYILKKES